MKPQDQKSATPSQTLHTTQPSTKGPGTGTNPAPPPPALNKNLSKALQKSEDSKNLPSPAESFQSFLLAHKESFAAVIPAHIPVDRILRLALSVASRNPTLLECSMPSLAGAVMQCTALGLEPGTALNQCHIIPFKNNKRGGIVEAQLVIDYHGYIELFYRTDKIQTVFANVVYQNDQFSFEYGTNEDLKHVPSKDASQKIDANITHFYAYAKMKNGAYRFVVLTKSDVDKVRDEFSINYQFAKKKDDSIWAKHYVAMGRKTAIRALQTWIPKSSEIQNAINADNGSFDPLKDANFNFPAAEGNEQDSNS